MSLFQARERWSTHAGEQEEFDKGCLCLGNFDNDASGDDKVAVGSFQGMLRVYYPKGADFSVQDLILEEDLSAAGPILQLLVGRFIPAASQLLALAVLQPRKLTVYTVEPVGGKGAKASYFNLAKAYDHQLGADGAHFTAFNMTHGPFGGVSRDLIAVQSMDGRLQVFEQDAHAFTRRLSSATLLPGPLCYVARTDSFVTATSELCVECYKYHALAASQAEPAADPTNTGSSSSSSGIARGRSVQLDWSVKVGETVSDIFVAKFSGASLGPNNVDIVVVGEQTLFTLKEQGGIRLQKFLSFAPSAVCKYIMTASDPTLQGRCVDQEIMMAHVGSENLILGTDAGSLLVYRGLQLVWSAKLKCTPVAVAVSAFGGVSGMVVTLDETGQLDVLYMGTDPPTQAVVSSDTHKELDYEAIDAEHRELLQVIRRSQAPAAAGSRSKLVITAKVASTIDTEEETREQQHEDAGSNTALARVMNQDPRGPSDYLVQMTAHLYIRHTDVQVPYLKGAALAVHLPKGFVAVTVPPLLPVLSEEPCHVALTIHARRDVLAEGLMGEATVLHSGGDSGAVTTSSATFKLPLGGALRLTSPVKTATYKLTIDTNRGPVSLLSLFEDMIGNSSSASETDEQRAAGSSSATVMSFAHWTQDPAAEGTPLHVSILVSKSAGRYRVQSATLAGLWLITNELVTRLNGYWATREGQSVEQGAPPSAQPPFSVGYSEPMPLQDVFAAVDEHFRLRQEFVRASADLNDAAHQFRVIEKRLLVRFKDRNPTPLSGLDALMEETYVRVLHLGDECQRVQDALAAASNGLACTLQLLCLLLQLRFALSPAACAVLREHLCVRVSDAGAAADGWHELCDAGMTHLLRTVLAKNARETVPAQGGGAAAAGMPADTEKLKKHITIVCDRLSKGAQLVLPPGDSKGSSSSSSGSSSKRRSSESKSAAGGSDDENTEAKGE